MDTLATLSHSRLFDSFPPQTEDDALARINFVCELAGSLLVHHRCLPSNPNAVDPSATELSSISDFRDRVVSLRLFLSGIRSSGSEYHPLFLWRSEVFLDTWNTSLREDVGASDYHLAWMNVARDLRIDRWYRCGQPSCSSQFCDEVGRSEEMRACARVRLLTLPFHPRVALRTSC